MRLDEEYVKRLFRRGLFGYWDPEIKQKGVRQEMYIRERADVLNMVKGGERVLDAGTGKGRFAISFALAGAQQVVAVDISKEMVDIARKRAEKAGVAERVVFKEGDVECLDFEEGLFDTVCCMDTFVHLPNPQQAMSELYRVCKVGGLVIANATKVEPLDDIHLSPSSKVRESIYKVLRAFYYHKAMYLLRKIAHKYFGTPLERINKPIAQSFQKGEFVKLFQDAGLSVEDVLEYRYPPVAMHFLVFAKKVATRS